MRRLKGKIWAKEAISIPQKTQNNVLQKGKRTEIVPVRLTLKELEALDMAKKAGSFMTRSEIIRNAVYDFLAKLQQEGGKA
jgi:hypothetical protein